MLKIDKTGDVGRRVPSLANFLRDEAKVLARKAVGAHDVS
jgi:hypothetical protein